MTLQNAESFTQDTAAPVLAGATSNAARGNAGMPIDLPCTASMPVPAVPAAAAAAAAGPLKAASAPAAVSDAVADAAAGAWAVAQSRGDGISASGIDPNLESGVGLENPDELGEVAAPKRAASTGIPVALSKGEAARVVDLGELPGGWLPPDPNPTLDSGLSRWPASAEGVARGGAGPVAPLRPGHANAARESLARGLPEPPPVGSSLTAELRAAGEAAEARVGDRVSGPADSGASTQTGAETGALQPSRNGRGKGSEEGEVGHRVSRAAVPVAAGEGPSVKAGLSCVAEGGKRSQERREAEEKAVDRCADRASGWFGLLLRLSPASIGLCCLHHCAAGFCMHCHLKGVGSTFQATKDKFYFFFFFGEGVFGSALSGCCAKEQVTQV